MMPMPLQKPYQSKQDYATPAPFLEAVRHRLGIAAFAFDFAADAHSAIAPRGGTSPTMRWPARPPSGRRDAARVGLAQSAVCSHRAVGGQVRWHSAAWRPARLPGSRLGRRELVLQSCGRAGAGAVVERTIGLPAGSAQEELPQGLRVALFAPEVAPGYEVWTWKAPRVEQVA